MEVVALAAADGKERGGGGRAGGGEDVILISEISVRGKMASTLFRPSVEIQTKTVRCSSSGSAL